MLLKLFEEGRPFTEKVVTPSSLAIFFRSSRMSNIKSYEIGAIIPSLKTAAEVLRSQPIHSVLFINTTDLSDLNLAIIEPVTENPVGAQRPVLNIPNNTQQQKA